MAYAYEIPVTIAGPGADARIHGHLIHTDQPRTKGGNDNAPSPYDLFLASIGTCAATAIHEFCVRRDIAADDIRLTQRVAFDDHGDLNEVTLALSLPPSFPEKYVEVLQRVVEECPVEKVIRAQPTFLVTHHRR